MALACYDLRDLQSGSFGHPTSRSLVHMFVLTPELIFEVSGGIHLSDGCWDHQSLALLHPPRMLKTLRACICLMTIIGVCSGIGTFHFLNVCRDIVVRRMIDVIGELLRVERSGRLAW